jgi:uncharacterized surface protein with fasciclin (FAS1) repeats
VLFGIDRQPATHIRCVGVRNRDGRNAAVERYDIAASNGVIHAIDDVLMPAAA